MIHIKIYNKGRSKTHTYVKAHCPMQQIVAQMSALLIATCRIARDAMTDADKDKFLQMMGAAWDAESERRGDGE